MRRLLRAMWLVAASVIAPLPMEAQDTPRVEIVAPAPLTRRLMTAASESRPVRIHWHSYEGSGTRIDPSLWVVNGTPLGLRSDGTIDQAAAKRELGRIWCKDVVSIDVLRGAEATTRFGPNVPDGVVLLVTRSPGVGDDADEP